LLEFIYKNIAIIISLFALFLSTYNFLYSIYVKEKKIEIDIVGFKNGLKDGKQWHIIQIVIQNCSQLPISINNISSCDVYCEFESSLVKEETRSKGKEIVSHTETKSIQFPINLTNLESASGYLIFKFDKIVELNKFAFTVYTNRGVIKSVKPAIKNTSKGGL